jgi:hypothetical protein
MVRRLDPRRWIAFKAIGISRLWILIEPAVEDVEGALADGQLDVAAGRLRHAVLNCLSVWSVRDGGQVLEGTEFDRANWDPIFGLDRDLVRNALRLSNDAFVANGPEEKSAIIDRLHTLRREVKDMLGLKNRWQVRTPDGAMLLVRFIREWDRHLVAMGLPSSLPRAWAKEDAPN